MKTRRGSWAFALFASYCQEITILLCSVGELAAWFRRLTTFPPALCNQRRTFDTSVLRVVPRLRHKTACPASPRANTRVLIVGVEVRWSFPHATKPRPTEPSAPKPRPQIFPESGNRPNVEVDRRPQTFPWVLRHRPSSSASRNTCGSSGPPPFLRHCVAVLPGTNRALETVIDDLACRACWPSRALFHVGDLGAVMFVMIEDFHLLRHVRF